MSATLEGFRWTGRRLFLLEAGLLTGAVSGGAALTSWLFGPDAAGVVVLEGLLAIPVFLLAEAYARRRRRERERRAAEDIERGIRDVANGAETRIK